MGTEKLLEPVGATEATSETPSKALSSQAPVSVFEDTPEQGQRDGGRRKGGDFVNAGT